MTLYRKIFTKDRLPEQGVAFLTEKGKVFSFDLPRCEWWLEEVELPTEEQIKAAHGLKIEPHMVNFHNGYAEGFEDGANYILNKLKG